MKTLLILLLSSTVAFAAEKISGQIVYADRTEDVTLLIPTGLFGGSPNTEAIQKGIRYIDAKGKKRKLKPDQAKEFYFSCDGQDYRFVSRQYSPGIFSRNTFLLQLIDGPVKMYEHRVTKQNFNRSNWNGLYKSNDHISASAWR